MNKEELLPIGSVVLLKGAIKKLMIVGYAQQVKNNDEKSKDTSKIWDYAASLYPEGYISSDQIFLFDHSQIEQVFYKGYIDDEQKEFIKKVNELMHQLKNNNVNIINVQNTNTNNSNLLFDLDKK